ncbi:MAG: hypothetical protein ACE5GU_13400 [Candidatus Scalinduaceae bacterium]
MTVTKTRMKLDRRRGPDFWIRILGWLGGISWFLMFAAMFIIDRAKPEAEKIITRASGAEVSTTWDQTLIGYLFYLVIFGLCISTVGIMINSKRYRRDEDRFRLTLILLGMLSIFGIAIYLFTFLMPDGM